MKRPGRAAGRLTYDAYLKARSRPAAGPARPRTVADVAIATCTGLERLSAAFGQRVVRISMAGSRPMAELRATGHGGWTVLPGGTGLVLEPGWSDWRPVPVSYEATAGRPLAPEVRIARDMLRVPLDHGVGRPDFERRLAALLRHRELREVMADVREVARRHATGGSLVPPDRFSVGDPEDPETWDRVADLYVIDPGSQIMNLSLAVAAAAMADGRTDEDRTRDEIR